MSAGLSDLLTFPATPHPNLRFSPDAGRNLWETSQLLLGTCPICQPPEAHKCPLLIPMTYTKVRVMFFSQKKQLKLWKLKHMTVKSFFFSSNPKYLLNSQS